tara:strand:- start:216 stop:380 length:165 start_codon:yes stop_codon:yes gene_type:complete
LGNKSGYFVTWFLILCGFSKLEFLAALKIIKKGINIVKKKKWRSSRSHGRPTVP